MAETAFEKTRLLASDFDNTIALTSEILPGGKTVEGAYATAILEVLGSEALSKYIRAGGLRNRAPVQVVAELKPALNEAHRRQRTEDIVAKKLSILLPQFGERLPDGRLWPAAVEGMPETWSQLSSAPEVNTAVITSGHDEAVSRFFDIHDLPQPDITVTDDDMRPLNEKLPTQLCVKPSRLLIDWAHQRWLEHLELGVLIDENPEAYLRSRNHITYVGDDIRKDGRLAANAGVDFLHIPISDPAPAWQQVGRLLVPEAFDGVVRV